MLGDSVGGAGRGDTNTNRTPASDAATHTRRMFGRGSAADGVRPWETGNPGQQIGTTDTGIEARLRSIVRELWEQLQPGQSAPPAPPSPVPGNTLPLPEYVRTWIELLLGFARDSATSLDSPGVRSAAERAMAGLLDGGTDPGPASESQPEFLLHLIATLQDDLRAQLRSSGSLAEYNRSRVLTGGWVLLPLSAKLAGRERNGTLRLHVPQTGGPEPVDRVVVSLHPSADGERAARHYLFRTAEPREVLVRGADEQEVAALNDAGVDVRFRSAPSPATRFDGFSDHGSMDTLGLIDLWG